MREAWEQLIVGPPDADRSVLLLPGGANAARSFDLVMAEPALSGVRLVATTLPGMAGAPVSEDVSVPALARRAAELAKDTDCDVVAGFSHGATVALEMVLSGQFQGPVVLLGISLTTEVEARVFRGAVRASQKVGSWPMAILLRLLPLMIRSAKISEPHKKELIKDLKQNRAGDSVRVSAAYLDYIAADRNFAAELASSDNPVWVVHAEKGDGGLTDAERATLQAAPNVTLVTIPGAVFLLPDEAPQHTAAAIASALTRACLTDDCGEGVRSTSGGMQHGRERTPLTGSGTSQEATSGLRQFWMRPRRGHGRRRTGAGGALKASGPPSRMFSACARILLSSSEPMPSAAGLPCGPWPSSVTINSSPPRTGRWRWACSR